MDLNSAIEACVTAQISNPRVAYVCCFHFQSARDCIFTLKFDLLRYLF